MPGIIVGGGYQEAVLVEQAIQAAIVAKCVYLQRSQRLNAYFVLLILAILLPLLVVQQVHFRIMVVSFHSSCHAKFC